MRNFLQIAAGIDTVPVLNALARHPELWDQNRLRTTHPGTAHADVSDIWLWFNDTANPGAIPNDREVIPYPAWFVLPCVRRIVLDLMHRVDGVRLGRVLITRLPPGKTITPHVDGGAPATFYSRYQVALKSSPGVVFQIGDEKVSFRGGEVWHIDNTVEHSVVNNSDDDRIVLIVDIRSE